MEPASVRKGAKRTLSVWEERADQTDMEVCPDITGECSNRDAVEVLGWYATVSGIRTEPIQMQECETKSHPCRQSSARLRPTKLREVIPSREL